MNLGFQLGLGIVLSSMIAALAYWRKSLSKSGVLGAMIVGTAIFGFGGWTWGMVLITFFVLSTLLSKFKEADKETIAADKFDKGNQRDMLQAFANAGIGALCAVIYWFIPDPVILAAFVGAMGTANADTWATELGVLSKNPPRLITSFAEVEYGTSGGVTVQGTLATLTGAVTIGLAALGLIALDGVFGGIGFVRYELSGLVLTMRLIPVAALGGLAGSLFDSLLGATVQAIYWSEPRQKETEKVIDPDGTPNTLMRGWRWLNNDLVNLTATIVGAVLAALLWMFIR